MINYDNSVILKIASAMSALGGAGEPIKEVGKIKNLFNGIETFGREHPTATKIGVPIVVSLSFAGFDMFYNTIKDWLAARNARTMKYEYFEKMMEAHPALKKEDPEIIAKYWESLYHFAPNMAADPLASGAYIRQSLQRGYIDTFGGPSPDQFKTLSDIQNNFNRIPSKEKKAPFAEGMNKTIGSFKLYKDVYDSANDVDLLKTYVKKYPDIRIQHNREKSH